MPASSAGFGRIRWRFRITQAKRGDTPAMLPPEFEQDVSANGNSNQGGTTDFGIVHHAEKIGSVLLHGGGTFANFRISVTTQIGKN
jgi:hypothetical protein